MEKLDAGDFVLCTVERIAGTVVFVKIEGDIASKAEAVEGSIVLSEIAPGRIRNLREYVVPNKKIVCKVLRVSKDRIDLSLRRVTKKEEKEVKERYQKEQNSINILKGILGESSGKIIQEISKDKSVYDFLQEAKENSTELEKLAGKENSKRILDAVSSQKKKIFQIKKEITLHSAEPDGVDLIKKLLNSAKNAEIKYISAGRYSIKTESKDPKFADNEIKKIIESIEENARQKGAVFAVK